MKKTKYLIALGSLVAINIPLITAISCGSKDETLPKLKGFSKLIAEYPESDKVMIQAKIVKWVDGDTPTIKYTDKATKKEVQTNVRIRSIDTPESHVPSGVTNNITPEELKWGKAAGAWASEEVPVGSDVILWTNGTHSYDRVVGSIFYTKDPAKPYNENYGVNIIKSGYTLPRIDGARGTLRGAATSTYDSLHYLLPALYQAWEEGKSNRSGLYALSTEEQTAIYGEHGIPANALVDMPEFLKTMYGSRHDYTDDETKKWIDSSEFKKYDIY